MNYPKFPQECRSLLCRFLTPELFEALKTKRTRYGYTLEQAIHSGVVNPDSSIGVYAGDEESYTLFAPLFDPIIEAYHGFGKDARHVSDLDPSHLHAPDPDPEGRYILSTRIRVGRNLHCFPLGPNIARREWLIAECMISDALRTLEGRGIYHNDAKTFLVWGNEEDQLRIISMQPGGDIQAVFARLVQAIGALERRLHFAYSAHLGYITSCPTNLGTAMRASVHIRLPRLGAERERFEAITERHHLQIRGVHGEHSESEGGIYDISNRRRLGITEVEAVQEMYEGVRALIEAERALESE